MASIVEKEYQARMDALSPAERVARSAAMFQWAREMLAKQVMAELGDVSEDRLKWEVALRQYGAEPAVRAMIGELLQNVPVNIFRATVSRFVSILNRHGIRFHLTGGITTVAWGEPRMTQDIDFVIDNDAISARMEPFLATLEASVFMFDASSIREAVQQHGLFQLLDMEESLKLDVYARELIPGELDRSELTEVFDGLALPIACRADAALSKLVWISKGSHKSRRDLRKIYDGASDEERERIRSLAEQLELTTLLNNVLTETDEIDQ